MRFFKIGAKWARSAFIVGLLLCAPQAFGQYEGDDVYDPFADYSEFEENSQEEADIHFFKNGRFFNFAFLLGWEQFTSEMGTYIDPNITPGMYFAFFFNLRYALQISYNFSQHNIFIPQGTNSAGQPFSAVSGNVSHSTVGVDLKYYFNTQNVTRGLAALNPYLLGGFSQIYRTFSLEQSQIVSKDNASSFDFGAGMEVPISDNRMYLGLQLIYHLIDFPAENKVVQDSNDVSTGVFFAGDQFDIHFILGINF